MLTESKKCCANTLSPEVGDFALESNPYYIDLPVKISFAREYVDKLEPGVLLVERELHGPLKGIAKKSKIVEPGQGQGQQVIGGRRKFVSKKDNKIFKFFRVMSHRLLSV